MVLSKSRVAGYFPLVAHHVAAVLFAAILLVASAGAKAAPFAYVAWGAYNEVAVIDLANDQIHKRILVGIRPRGVAVSQETPRAYVSNYGSDTVSVIDTDSNTVVEIIAVQNEPMGLAVSPDGSRVYVTNQGSGSVSVINAASNTVIATWIVPDSPGSLATSPDGTRLYVSQGGSPRIHVLDTATGVRLADPVACQYPGNLTMHPSGRKYFVACPHTNRVVSLDTTTHTIVDDFTMTDWPAGLAISPTGDRLYVVRRVATVLDTVDLSTGQVIGSVSIRSGNFPSPLNVGISPDGTRAYTTELNGPMMSVVNTVTQTLHTQIQNGNGLVGTEAITIGLFIGGRGSLTAPVIQPAIGADRSVHVHFAPPMFRGSLPVLNYTATCGSQSASGVSSPILVGGLVNGIPVRCSVHATNAAGTGPESALSNEVVPNVPPPPQVPPPAPVLLDVESASLSARVVFEPIPNPDFPVIEYEGLCQPSGRTARSTTSPITVTGLLNGGSYECSVRARNQYGWGVYSPARAVVPASVSLSPFLVSAIGGVGEITLNFSVPGSNGGRPILDYLAQCSGIEAIGAESPLVVTGLANGETHTCSVRARNEVGLSAPSNERSAFVGRVPDAPVLVSVTPGATLLTVAFDAPVSDGGLTILKYVVDCGSRSVEGTVSPLTVTQLANGTDVPCSVRAENALGFSAASNTVNGMPRDVPEVPVVTLVEVISQQLHVTFARPFANGAPILGLSQHKGKIRS
jgi:YVTN family beta-propeller protein